MSVQYTGGSRSLPVDEIIFSFSMKCEQQYFPQYNGHYMVFFDSDVTVSVKLRAKMAQGRALVLCAGSIGLNSQLGHTKDFKMVLGAFMLSFHHYSLGQGH